jgi:hypothetical protein
MSLPPIYMGERSDGMRVIISESPSKAKACPILMHAFAR